MEPTKTQRFVEILRQFRIEPKVIFDVGAFDGAQSVELAHAFPDAAILAFEPVPENVTSCLVNVSHYRSINFYPVAVGAANGRVTFNQSTGRNKECGSLLKPNGKYWEPMPVREIDVECIRLDCLEIQPDAMWMDVQGTELDVLRGLGEMLPKLKAFWAEVTYQAYYQGQPLAEEFTRQVEAMGFTKVHESVAMPNWFGDACFVNNSLQPCSLGV